jgi:hypothetical protein
MQLPFKHLRHFNAQNQLDAQSAVLGDSTSERGHAIEDES